MSSTDIVASGSRVGAGAALRHEALEPVDVVGALRERRARQQAQVQRDRGRDARDDVFLERAPEPHHAGVAVGRLGDDLADQAVVVGRDAVAVVERGIHAHAGAARRVVAAHRAGGGAEGRRVLGVDAALDGVALEAHVALREGQPLAGGDADLLLHQVDAGDHLGDRVLHLDARVHLHEVEGAVLVEELQRADPAVAELAARRR